MRLLLATKALILPVVNCPFVLAVEYPMQLVLVTVSSVKHLLSAPTMPPRLPFHVVLVSTKYPLPKGAVGVGVV